jgi:hypothetical protein
MRKMYLRTFFVAMLSIAPIIVSGHTLDEPAERTTSTTNVDNSKVLVIRAINNVKSNYYTMDLLAENTDIAEDSVNSIYNRILEMNLEEAGSGLHFAGIDVHQMNSLLWKPIMQDIRLEGDGENMRADLSRVDKNALSEAMRREGARYLLVIDAQYLRYSETPMPMMYHFVNYSLYDNNEKQLCSGQNYFSAYEPQSTKELAKSSKKAMKKIASKINETIKGL